MPTYWADVSQYQVPVNDSYPHRVFCYRTNSGDKLDTKADQNLDWAIRRMDEGKLDVVIAYYFFRPGQGNCDLWRQKVTRNGKIDPRIVCMIDVEGDNGSVRGDNSREINEELERVVGWLGGNRKRVIGYQNPISDPGLWLSKPAGLRMVIPSYGRKPGDLHANTPADMRNRMLGHQYGDNIPCAPFGPCDGNYSPLNIDQFLAALGLEEEDDMAGEGAYVKGQFQGSDKDSLGGNSGWEGLAPQPDSKGNRFSQFLKKNVDRQSLVEGLGTVIFETTYRILPYRKQAQAKVPETVLGHAAAAHGTALDIEDKVDALDAKLDEVLAALKAKK